MKPVCNMLLLTPFSDKSLQNAEFCVILWHVTFGIVDDEMFIVKRGYSFVYIGSASLVMLDILNGVMRC